jgi:hypothetical protein
MTPNIFIRAESAYHAALDLDQDVRNFVEAMRDIRDGYFRDAHCALYGAGMTEADPAESEWASVFDERPKIMTPRPVVPEQAALSPTEAP